MQVQAYLFFDGRCEEAANFYREALGAEVTMLLRFKDNPEPPGDACMAAPGTEEKVMHMSIQIGETTILASDGRCGGTPSFQGFSLAITAAGDAEADRLFAALCDGGEVQMAMARTFFASRFGVVADRFGVSWMVLSPP